MQRQLLDWQPVVDWFCHRHDISIKPSTNMIETPIISNEDREKIRRQLLSYSFNAVQGFTFGVDALKSLILMSAIVEHKLSVEHAVQLTRLETQFQVRKILFMNDRGKVFIESRFGTWHLWSHEQNDNKNRFLYLVNSVFEMFLQKRLITNNVVTYRFFHCTSDSQNA